MLLLDYFEVSFIIFLLLFCDPISFCVVDLFIFEEVNALH